MVRGSIALEPVVENLDAVLRYCGTYKGGPIRFRTGGRVVAHTILAVLGRELSKRHSPEIVRQIASSDWLLALMFDTKWNPGVKSRYQLAGVVDNDGATVRVCYIRNKSGHSEDCEVHSGRFALQLDQRATLAAHLVR